VTLLDSIAEQSNGARDYVTPGEDIEIVTGRFFRKVGQPVLSDVTVEFGSGVYDVYPQKLPDLFAGGQVVVFGRYREAGDRLIRLKGSLGGTAKTYDYEATFRSGEGQGFLPRLWAYRKVVFLLDEIRLRGETKEVVDEVVKLATRFAIVTPYTAGLVVEETEMAGGRDAPQFEARRRLREGMGRAGGGGGHRAPGGAVPPGVRRPGDPAAPAAPAPDSAPRTEADASKDLKKRKSAASGEPEDEAYDEIREKIASVDEKTFLLKKDGRWVDTKWDGKKETVKVELFSEAYFELLKKDEKVAKYFALGERVVFVLGDTVYETIPAP
jgi:Ca-activated chloride channel family protein